MEQLILLLFFGLCGSLVSAQVLETPANSSCQGVLMHYQLKGVEKISPFLSLAEAARQPYAFNSTLNISNLGFNEVKNWQASIRFQHNEWLVQAPGIVLESGEPLPAHIGNNETVFFGFPQTDLQNAVETAGDPDKTSLELKLTGTEFGVNATGFPLPSNISFLVDGYTCGSIAKIGNDVLQLCCSENKTAVNITAADIYLPPEQGDITIEYNVVQTSKGSYWAQVFISNDNLLGRMDGWNLTWEWKQGEFIKQIRGAQVLEQDQEVCLKGPAGEFYPDEDFSQVVSCLKKPTIIDLPIWFTNDTNIGMVPGCCRSGLLLPKIMDPSQSKSSFKLWVYKVPPNMDRLSLVPPASFDIGPRYNCSQPRLIAPIDIPDTSNKDRMLAAVRSWQVTCNLTEDGRARAPLTITDTPASTGCCVSFSGFYNASVVPCPTCSCGCPKNWTCSPEAPAMLMPTSQLLTAAVNRTRALVEWSRINRMPVPTTLPCPDNCGVNINWHVVSDFRNGWSARISILNWGPTSPEWFAGLELDRAMPGFKEVFSVNGTVLEQKNNTLYIQGKQGYNDYLNGVGATNFPGNLQAVVAFEKKKTPGINITGGDGFPSRVVFNGLECRLPTYLPSSGVRFLPSLPRSALLAALVSVLVLFV